MFELLDYRTMLFMSGLLAVALSIFLLLINASIAKFTGLFYWVCANLLIGIAILIFIDIIFDMVILVTDTCTDILVPARFDIFNIEPEKLIVVARFNCIFKINGGTAATRDFFGMINDVTQWINGFRQG